MKKLLLGASLVSGMLFLSCQAVPRHNTALVVDSRMNQIAILKGELAAFNLTDPSKDVIENLSKGDKRCIAVCGYVCSCPATGDSGVQLSQRIIRGTSDIREGEEHKKLIDRATEYATEYNKTLLINLSK